ncbi:hypothetical protein BKA56DRAFT_622064 [Ilyonectria sp. MPI-CAGE-AT-0026]|nr:hypothetical protein BKA56DRAFT_622064 [Ilyonectria sp. MPI-CAGE-AT-0026]
MILCFLFFYIALVGAFCTEVALWVPWRDETVFRAAEALGLETYNKIINLNKGLNPESITAWKTYTVPYTDDLKPPATWVELNGCTPLLQLNGEVTSTSVQETTLKTKPIKKTIKTTTASLSKTKTPSITSSTTKTTSTTSSTTKTPSTTSSTTKTPSATSSTTQTPSATSSTTKTPSTTSSTAQTPSTTSSTTKTPSTTSSTTQTPSATSSTTKTPSATSSTTKTPSTTSSTTQTPSATSPTTTITMACPNKTDMTTTMITTTVIPTVIPTVVATKTITIGAEAPSFASSPTCHPQGTYNTNEKKLEKYTKKFCSTIDGKSLKTNESLQYIYGKDKELLEFTVSWVPGCEGEEQAITGAGNLCSNTMINNWSSCNNGGQGGYTIRGCLMWIYRPNALVEDDDS